MTVLLIAGFFSFRALFDPAVSAIEALHPNLRQHWRPGPAVVDRLAGRRVVGRCRGLGDWQSGLGPAVGLSCDCDWHCRHCCHRDEKRGLAGSRREKT